MNDILNRVTLLIRSVFDADGIFITEDTVADDVEGWDSLNNIRLFVEIERAFGLRFSAAEISGLADVGAIVQLILVKRGSS